MLQFGLRHQERERLVRNVPILLCSSKMVHLKDIQIFDISCTRRNTFLVSSVNPRSGESTNWTQFDLEGHII